MSREFINIVEIRTTEVEFKINVNYQEDTDEEIGYKIALAPQLLQSEDDEFRGLIILKTQIFDEKFEEKNQPFFLKLTTIAEFDSTKTKKPFINFGAQALNVTIPYVRSFISTISSVAGTKPITLPIISIEELFDTMKKEKEKEKEKERKKERKKEK